MSARLPPGALYPVAVVLASIWLAAACDASRSNVILASTTSVDDTGLLDSLLVHYHSGSPHRVRAIVVGSGEALELGRRGDVDAVLAHSPADEVRFMADGHGRARHEIFRNDFVVVGPASDPAGVGRATDAPGAFQRIAEAGAAFVSRGDRSGTHQKELLLWQRSGPRVAADRVRIEAGLGMAETLRLADERAAYTLTDRATFLTLAPTLNLAVLLENDTALANPYSILVVLGARNESGAVHFADWLRGETARERIRRFTMAGHTPFMPADDTADGS